MAKLVLNRLRIVLAEKDKTNRWLAEKLKVNENTVSKWVTNNQQPSVETFYRIATLLQVNLPDLFENTKK
ncbi:MAG: transcriptional regulator [Citrobacter freundii]|nr:MAG: transcriptional regulator [Citrobacter freundii]